MKKGCLIIFVFLLICSLPALILSHYTKKWEKQYNTKIERFEEIGSIKKIHKDFDKYGYIKIDYWFDLPKGERYIDNSTKIGFNKDENVVVGWSIRESGDYVVDYFYKK